MNSKVATLTNDELLNVLYKTNSVGGIRIEDAFIELKKREIALPNDLYERLDIIAKKKGLKNWDIYISSFYSPNTTSTTIIISRILSFISILSILLLPIAGCGNDKVTGSEVIISDEVAIEIKLFLIISVICGLLILFLKKYTHAIIVSALGAITLLVSYFIAKDKVLGNLDLKVGAFVAIIGYVLTSLLCLFKIFEKNKIVVLQQNVASKNNLDSQDDTLAKIEKLNELYKKGVLTEEEFTRKKTDILSRL